MDVREVLGSATRRLGAAGVPTPEVDARWLLCHALGVTPSWLALRGAEAVPAGAMAQVDALVGRRTAREPLQLLLGSVGFRYLELEVRPGVFIPRPETEVLAGAAIERTPGGGVVVEPCTGTGAVACAVAQEAAASRVVATDRSAAAADLARANAAHLGLAVDVLEGDLLAPVPPELRGHVDVLVSNPPYVAGGELPALEPEVRDWDPVEALVSGPTGHECSDRLIAEGRDWLRPGGWLLVEVADTRAHEVAARCAAAGYEDTAVLDDLAGRPRVVRARRAGGRTIALE